MSKQLLEKQARADCRTYDLADLALFRRSEKEGASPSLVGSFEPGVSGGASSGTEDGCVDDDSWATGACMNDSEGSRTCAALLKATETQIAKSKALKAISRSTPLKSKSMAARNLSQQVTHNLPRASYCISRLPETPNTIWMLKGVTGSPPGCEWVAGESG